MSSRRLSIVIPCLNEAGVIGSLLQLLQPLRTQGHEVILVDGGSSDGTPAVAGPLVDCLLLSEAGRGRQMNRGAQVATREILWFLHADSLLPPGATQAVLEGLGQSGQAWGRFDVRFAGSHPLLRLVAFMMNWRSRLSGIATGDQGVFVAREAFVRVGGFPEIPLMEDVALSRALKRVSRPLCLRLPLVTSSRRWESRGILRTIVLMWWLRLAFALGVSPQRLARMYRPCSSPMPES
jgi:rSAM/selenodomain-associated transferase 2